MRKLVTMRHALSDPAFFGGPGMMGAPSWSGWRALLLAIMGEPLEPDELALYREVTGRDASPAAPVAECWAIVGRRGGKSRAMGTLAAYLAGCVDHRAVLAPGQRGRLPVIAQSKETADESLNYIKGAFEQSTALCGLVEGETDRTLSLKTRVDVQVRALSFRNLRGATNVGVICDEVAYWRSDESATPDAEVVRAIRPSLATTKGPLIAISSPYARKGLLYTTYVADYGPDGPARRLVLKAPTKTLNPDLDRDFLAQAYADDPVAAAAEYGAEFRDDVSEFINAVVVDRITVTGRTETPPCDDVGYTAFVDVGGGTGGDSYTAAIAHTRPMEGTGQTVAVLDLLFEVRPPYSPDEVTGSLCEILKRYRIAHVIGDNYGGAWPRERFAHYGIEYHPASKQNIAQLLDDDASKTGPLYASEIYRTFLALANSGRVELLDHPKMRAQLLQLERRTTQSGADSITHPKGGHDDLINAAAGACVVASYNYRRRRIVITQECLDIFSRKSAEMQRREAMKWVGGWGGQGRSW